MSYDERSFFAGKQEGRLECEAELARLRADMDQRMKAYVEYQERDEAEIKRLRAKCDGLLTTLRDMIEISQRNSEATLMLIAIRKCAEHALAKAEGKAVAGSGGSTEYSMVEIQGGGEAEGGK
jgi:hypothetical protein